MTLYKHPELEIQMVRQMSKHVQFWLAISQFWLANVGLPCQKTYNKMCSLYLTEFKPDVELEVQALCSIRLATRVWHGYARIIAIDKAVLLCDRS